MNAVICNCWRGTQLPLRIWEEKWEVPVGKVTGERVVGGRTQSVTAGSHCSSPPSGGGCTLPTAPGAMGGSPQGPLPWRLPQKGWISSRRAASPRRAHCPCQTMSRVDSCPERWRMAAARRHKQEYGRGVALGQRRGCLLSHRPQGKRNENNTREEERSPATSFIVSPYPPTTWIN